MFEFKFESFPKTDFGVESAAFDLFAFVPVYQDQIALDVKITANQRVFSGSEGEVEVQPVLSTQWLSVPISGLTSTGVDCLDGYQLKYDHQREEELGFDQFPGAIYTYTWGRFEHAEMTFRYLGAANYEIAANGTTEFNWAFDIKTKVPLTKIDLANEDRQRDPAVEAVMHQHFSSDAFEFGWYDAYAGASESWWHFRAIPKP